MKSFTRTAAACTLVVAITFGGGAAYADTIPAADTPTVAPAPAESPDGAGEESEPSAAEVDATAKRDEATAFIASKAGNASAVTVNALTAAVNALNAALDSDADDETLISLTDAVNTPRAAVEKSATVYTAARAALTDQAKLVAADLPKGILDAQKTTAAAVTAALTSLADDTVVNAAVTKVAAWSTNVRGYRPAKAAATSYATKIATLRQTKSYPAATTARYTEVVNSQTALNTALNAAVPQATVLNTASARAKAAITAWQQSNTDRAAAFKAAGTAYSAASAIYKKYASTVNTVYANPLKTTMASLTAGIHTATVAQLNTLTSKTNTATTNVTKAANMLATAKTTFANGSASQKVYTRVPAPQRAALANALAALKASINAKASPATLQVHITDVSSKAAAVKQAHINAPVREQLEWVAANAWARSYTWGHQYIYNEDCANFATHSLYIRGLGEQVLNISSTSLRNHLVGRGFRETADSPAARKNVKLGDVIQFDWGNNGRWYGDRDHTGIVTQIVKNANGTITIKYTAHTDPDNDPKVNQTIEASRADHGHDPNGRVYFISI